ncbi:tyrosine-type recombinase/integrase [Chryseobacterium sp. Ch-15]|uniref:Tyrosine-type recombinase/integrase n=1 Tax=Chryseobacterium muglaense TaxID=2893752 RepID=A0A9Q3USN5_9FLAO|nr:tyrosine-type recombinase/integrase [Chryseobacterium muglaense]MBD3904497.1 tyrosine-type recombinase/integrase [Chryseobacterium muglaense]MCC9032684.1 tyrosine-type recombinase/integrase [Chryseobacterium muglaense]MCM2554259.1 tyrosine-type recombinase/integrase [Chryseobacterium muglaense]
MSTLLETLLSEYSNEYNFDMSVVQYKLPKIYHGGKDFDLSQRWYVYYSYLNPSTGKMQRQNPIYMNVNRDYNTVVDRMKRLKSISKNLTELLKNGYSPYSDSEIKEKYNIKEAIEFAYEIKASTLAQTTIPEYKSRKNKFIKFLESNSYDVISADEFPKKYLLNYMNDIIKNNSGKTHNNHKVVLSSLFEILKSNEIIKNNFLTDINNQISNPKKNKSYSNKQLEILFDEISKDEKILLFIQFVSYNFLRPIEVVRLKFEDLKIDEKPAYLQVKAKNKPLKTKLIPSILLKELQTLQYSDSKDYVFKTNDKGIATTEINRRNYFSAEFKKIKDKLGLGEEYTLYSFRHTFITKLFRELRKERTELETYDLLMKITGHSTLKALKAYLRDIDAELAEDYSEFLE